MVLPVMHWALLPGKNPMLCDYLLEEALKTQKPKVVVMEVNCAFNDHKYSMGK